MYRKISCVRQRYSLRLFSADISKITFWQKIPHEIFLIFGRLGERGCVLADHGERKSNLLGQLLADDLRSLQRGGGRYIYIAPLLIHFAGLPILSNLVALSVSHTRFHLTGLSSNRFKSAFASVIPYRPPLSSLSPRVEKDFWTRGRSEENSATRRRIKFNRVLLRRIGRKVFGSIWLVLCFMIVGIFFVSSNKSLSFSLSPLSFQSNNGCCLL